MEKAIKSVVYTALILIKSAGFPLMLFVSVSLLIGCNKDENKMLIKRRIVELGTNRPIHQGGIKFLIIRKEGGGLGATRVFHVDSFATNSEGEYEHLFIGDRPLMNYGIRVNGEISGYFPNNNWMMLTNENNDLSRIAFAKRVKFNFRVDNSSGFSHDLFTFHMPGIGGFAGFVGQGLHSIITEQAAYREFLINFGNWRKDTSYLIPIFITELDSFTYTHVIER